MREHDQKGLSMPWYHLPIVFLYTAILWAAVLFLYNLLFEPFDYGPLGKLAAKGSILILVITLIVGFSPVMGGLASLVVWWIGSMIVFKKRPDGMQMAGPLHLGHQLLVRSGDPGDPVPLFCRNPLARFHGVKELPMHYCPISRNFYRIRRVLIEELGLPRQAVRPSATFAELVPREHRRRVVKRLDGIKADVLPLDFSRSQWRAIELTTIAWFAILIGLCLLPGSWMVFLAVAIPVLLRTRWVRRFEKTTEVDSDYTLGEVALDMTTVRECVESGYEFTRNEIFRKVCVIAQRSAGVNRHAIKLEMSWQEDMGVD